MIICSAVSVPLSAVSLLNVVCLREYEEILTLVATHSEYELKETTTTTYNWAAIEREVVQRFISNKPKISFSKEQLPCYVYQEDFNLHNQLQALHDTQVSVYDTHNTQLHVLIYCLDVHLTVSLLTRS